MSGRPDRARMTKLGRTTSRAFQLAAAILVVVLVLAGIWVSGGLITNDFALAMALTAVWMGVAAVGCLLVAWRRPGLRVPVLGAYLLTAVVVGVYLGRSTLIDDEVNERVVRVTPPATDGGSAADRPRNVLLGRGRFVPVGPAAHGTATTGGRARGGPPGGGGAAVRGGGPWRPPPRQRRFAARAADEF